MASSSPNGLEDIFFGESSRLNRDGLVGMDVEMRGESMWK